MSQLIALEDKRDLEWVLWLRAWMSLVTALALVSLHTLALYPNQDQRSTSTAENCFNSGLTRPSTKVSKAPIATGLGLDPQKSAQHHCAEVHGFSLDHYCAEQ